MSGLDIYRALFPGNMRFMMNRIEHLRKARGMSMDALAELANTTASTISKLEKGRMQLTQEWMVRIATALEVAPGDLLGSPYHGFSDNAEPYTPGPGHYLAASPHYAYFRIVTDDLDQHPAGLTKGRLAVFDINRSDPHKISPGDIVAATRFDRADMLKSHGVLIATFLPPDKLCSNAARQNWMIRLDDPAEPFHYVIRGTLVSVLGPG